MKTQEKVNVPGRFNRLIVRECFTLKGIDYITADFESGFGFVSLPAHMFEKGWR